MVGMDSDNRPVQGEITPLKNYGKIGLNQAQFEFPARFDDVEQLDDFLSKPRDRLVNDLADVDGDILILGVSGKMGPTLARMAN